MTALWGVVGANGRLLGRVRADWRPGPISNLKLVPPEVADVTPLPDPYVPPEPEPAEPVRLTPREFMSRLTLTRQQEITAAAVTLVAQGNAGPMTWLFRLLGAVYVDPAEPETAGGVAALEAAGLITAEEAAALLA